METPKNFKEFAEASNEAIKNNDKKALTELTKMAIKLTEMCKVKRPDLYGKMKNLTMTMMIASTL